MTINEQVRVFLQDFLVESASPAWEDEVIDQSIYMAVTLVSVDYPHSYEITEVGEENIDPEPSAIYSLLFALKASIILLGGDTLKASRDSIYVKDGDTVIDTTKGGSSKISLLESLKSQYNGIIHGLRMNGGFGGDASGLGYRVDMYT